MATLIKTMGHEVQFFKGDRIAKQLKYEPGLEKTRIVAIWVLYVIPFGVDGLAADKRKRGKDGQRQGN
jgi:hypothetical protein